MKIQMSLRIPKKSKEELKKMADLNGYSLNTLVLFIINDYLKHNELELKK